MNYSLRTLLLLGVAAELVVLLISYLLFPSMEETFRHAARYSGRLSAVVFMGVFYLYATSVPKPVIENRLLRYGLITFAVMHVIHFGFLATNVWLNNIPMVPTKLTGGALAYLMIVAAPFVLHRLKRGFQLVYFYYVSLVMIITYVARINGDFEGAEPFWLHYVMMGAIILGAIYFGWRIRQGARLSPVS